MAFNGITNRIIARSITSPKLGKAANIFGGVMSTITMGRYKVGLSRAGYIMSQEVKAGDILSVRDGRAFVNGSILYSNKQLFDGIKRDHVPVTPEMCTPQGMISSLRWDLVGNAPQIMREMAGLIGPALFLYSDISPLLNGHNITSGDVFGYVITSIIVLPYYKLIGMMTKGAHRNLRLTDVEEVPVDIKEVQKPLIFSKDKSRQVVQLGGGRELKVGLYHKLFAGGFALADDEDVTVYVYGKKDAPGMQPIIKHEAAHKKGASELTAFQIAFDKAYKMVMYENKGLYKRIKAIAAGFTPLLSSLVATGIHNISALTYGIRLHDMTRYYKEYPDRTHMAGR